MNNNEIKIFLISNMYPSRKHRSYGVFIKRFVTNFRYFNIDINWIASIKGKRSDSVSKIFAYFYFYIRIFFIFIFAKYNVIIVHYPIYVMPLLSGLVRIKKPKLFIINFHGGDVISNKRLENILINFSKKSINMADLFIVPSGYFSGLVSEIYKIPKDKLIKYPSGGIDLKSYFPISNKENSSTFKIGCISRFVEGKGWETLIEATSIFKREVENIQLILIGEGYLRKKLEILIDDLNIKEISIFIDGSNLSDSEANSLLNSLDVFVFPTEFNESLGLVGIEALACGIPIITTNKGGISDYFNEGFCGFQFEEKSATSLARKLSKFYHLEEEEKNKMQLNCLETASNFDSNRCTLDLINTIKHYLK